MSRQTGIHKETVDVAPLFQATIIEHFEFIGYNERGNAICQAFLEQKQTANTTIIFYRQVICSFSSANISFFAYFFANIFRSETLRLEQVSHLKHTDTTD